MYPNPIHSHSNLRQPVVAAAVATCSPSLLPASYEFCSMSRRRFSSFFRNSLMHELSVAMRIVEALGQELAGEGDDLVVSAVA